MRIILLGPPGSGKGTVSEKLVRDFSLKHVSAGELLREEVSKKTSLGKEIKKYIEKGDLVPHNFVIEMVKLEVGKKDNYILDGFPRSVDQAEGIKDLGIDLVIYLELSEKVVVERISGRRVCEKGTHSYHLKYIPPKVKGKCDVDGSKLILRKDDTVKVVKERFRVYTKNTGPLVKFYVKKGLLKRVDGAPSPKKVYDAVKKIVESQKS
jgi:adenylate kinase